jgi:membrane associated rhomboid family serine protease
MQEIYRWLRRRRYTLGLASFFILWYLLQLTVAALTSTEVAKYWFYIEIPPQTISPGLVFAPISHDLQRITHLGANLLFLLVAGGLIEPYIGGRKVARIVLGIGYLSIYLANLSVTIHQKWMIAGASGGVLGLWAYAGFRSRELTSNLDSPELVFTRGKAEGFVALLLLLGTPVFLIHQTILVSRPHSGHIIGILLGIVYFGVDRGR